MLVDAAFIETCDASAARYEKLEAEQRDGFIDGMTPTSKLCWKNSASPSSSFHEHAVHTNTHTRFHSDSLALSSPEAQPLLLLELKPALGEILQLLFAADFQAAC
jgi:hypothetical protein